jgi:hypothetical protein
VLYKVSRAWVVLAPLDKRSVIIKEGTWQIQDVLKRSLSLDAWGSRVSLPVDLSDWEQRMPASLATAPRGAAGGTCSPRQKAQLLAPW